MLHSTAGSEMKTLEATAELRLRLRRGVTLTLARGREGRKETMLVKVEINARLRPG